MLLFIQIIGNHTEMFSLQNVCGSPGKKAEKQHILNILTIPLISRETVVNLISNTKTDKGFKIMAMLDENIYQTGRKISDKELAEVNLRRENFHGEWNYIISPSEQKNF